MSETATQTDDWIIVKPPSTLRYAANFITIHHRLIALQIIFLLMRVDWKFLAVLRAIMMYNKYKKYTGAVYGVGKFVVKKTKVCCNLFNKIYAK